MYHHITIYYSKMLIESVKPSFSDFKLTKIGYVSAKQNNIILQVNDYVLDKYGIAGQVRFVDETYGNYIVFVDDYETYDDKLQLRKLTTAGLTTYNYQKSYYYLLIKLARILNETLSEFFPYTNIFMKGTDMWVRGSTLKALIEGYTHQKLTGNHSYFSAKLNPKYTCDIEAMIIKERFQDSWFNRELIKAIFIDFDLKMKESRRIKWIVSEKEEYNKKWWKHYINQYRKFNIKYLGTL